MGRTPSGFPSLALRAEGVPGALARHAGVPGFDQGRLSSAHVVCVGAGGLVGHVAPALARKGVGALTILDDDVVEASNLNRQYFHAEDIGAFKAEALVRRLLPVCTFATALTAVPVRLEAALEAGVDLACDAAVVGVDHNGTRMRASRLFRRLGVPAVFCAVSADADHGWVLVQAPDGPCPACLFPDAVGDARRPCPGTPAASDILQAIGALAAYAVDGCLMPRPRRWTYRRVSLGHPDTDGASALARRPGCRLCGLAAPTT
jgi:hypothetical protein